MPSDSPSTRWLTPSERDAWLALGALMFRLPGMVSAQLQADAGLSFFEYMVLAALSEQPDGTLQMSELADLAQGSLSRLSHTAKRLEDQGFIRREKAPGRGRTTKAILTPPGRQKVVETAPGHVEHVRRLVIDALAPEDLAALARIGSNVLGTCPSTSAPAGSSGAPWACGADDTD